jgi:hypothetical protein
MISREMLRWLRLLLLTLLLKPELFELQLDWVIE